MPVSETHVYDFLSKNESLSILQLVLNFINKYPEYSESVDINNNSQVRNFHKRLNRVYQKMYLPVISVIK